MWAIRSKHHWKLARLTCFVKWRILASFCNVVSTFIYTCVYVCEWVSKWVTEWVSERETWSLRNRYFPLSARREVNTIDWQRKIKTLREPIFSAEAWLFCNPASLELAAFVLCIRGTSVTSRDRHRRKSCSPRCEIHCLLTKYVSVTNFSRFRSSSR